MKKQKPLISFLLPTLLIGGAEKTLVDLSNGLSASNWHIQLLVMTNKGPLVDDVSSDVEIINLDCSSYRKAALALVKYYNEYKPTTILTSLYATGLVAIVSQTIASHKPKIIIGGHNSLLAKSTRPDNWKDKFFLLPLCKILFPRAEGVIAVSRGVALEIQTLIKLPPERIHIIYNPVVTQKLLRKKKETVSHPWLVAPSQRDFKTLISVGRLVEQKGFDILLEALFRAKESINCRLIIVGGGPLQEDLIYKANILKIKEFVDFVGWQENPYKYIARADLFVLSSRWEGLANVIIEALACGCPVVSTNCKYGPEEILEGGKYGTLAKVNNPCDIASKILEVFTEPNYYLSGRKKRMAHAFNFTVEAAVEQYKNYFEKIMHK